MWSSRNRRTSDCMARPASVKAYGIGEDLRSTDSNRAQRLTHVADSVWAPIVAHPTALGDRVGVQTRAGGQPGHPVELAAGADHLPATGVPRRWLMKPSCPAG